MKKSFLAFLLVCVMVVGAGTAFAAETTGNKVEPVVSVTAESEPYIRQEARVAANPNDPIGSCSAVVEEFPETRGVSISKDITVAIGQSWSDTFNTSKLFTEDHNAFKVIVSDVSGSRYKILVVNSNGWTYETPEYTDGCTMTVTNVSGDDDYTVYVQNLGTGTLSAHVKISSYYEQ